MYGISIKPSMVSNRHLVPGLTNSVPFFLSSSGYVAPSLIILFSSTRQKKTSTLSCSMWMIWLSQSTVQNPFLNFSENSTKNFVWKTWEDYTTFLGYMFSHEKGCFVSTKIRKRLTLVASMIECTPMPTPLPLQLNMTKDQSELFSNSTYFRSLACKLQYLTLASLDIHFAVNFVCQKMQFPKVSDFQTIERIIWYVKGTITMGISLHKNTDFTLTAYSDMDWTWCYSTRRSTGGFSTFLRKNLILWSSRKQPTVSRSSTETEYWTISETTSELILLCSFFRELGLLLLTAPMLLCDNLSVALLSPNPFFHSKTKHFALNYHFVWEQMAFGALEVKHIPNQEKITDIFTKSLLHAALKTRRLFKNTLGASWRWVWA